jgi:hypothetical protein
VRVARRRLPIDQCAGQFLERGQSGVIVSFEAGLAQAGKSSWAIARQNSSDDLVGERYRP